MPQPEIRLLEERKEFLECERAQESIWGGLSVSSEVMLVTQKYGGTVLGAFVQGRVVGFLYALLARRNGQIIHWSHLMGVSPRFRSQGLGFRLKLAHRALALSQGIRSICWTFDPLQSLNASLNLGKLGARAEEYVVNCYGRFPSTIERGLPSDRFVVNWQIASKRIERRLATRKAEGPAQASPIVNATGKNARGFLVNRKINLYHQEARLLVEIPANTNQMREEALGLAKRWRTQTREIFQHYLSRGYRVDGFFTENRDATERRCFYLLRWSSR